MSDNLRAALVGRHERLYHMSAEFHHSLNLLAELLPSMVDGLAAAAERTKAANDEAIRRLMTGSLTATATPLACEACGSGIRVKQYGVVILCERCNDDTRKE